MVGLLVKFTQYTPFGIEQSSLSILCFGELIFICRRSHSQLSHHMFEVTARNVGQVETQSMQQMRISKRLSQ